MVKPDNGVYHGQSCVVKLPGDDGRGILNFLSQQGVALQNGQVLKEHQTIKYNKQ